MLYFQNDYSEGAHEAILAQLIRTNGEKLAPYGSDIYSATAKEKILAACGCPEGDAFFISGGTQTNAIVIAAMLRGYEAAVAARTGHINFHEAGAIEATGHKVLDLPHHLGKIDPAELRQFLTDFWADANCAHMAAPGMVYLSHPTEYGTLYTRGELEAISAICREFDIPLFLDGARLGYGLASRSTDLDLPTIARLCDVFYIGGTKVGALCGEAVVFPKGNMPKAFLTTVKQHGGLLAKGRLLGVQFDALFTDNLYLSISQNAIDRAEEMKEGFQKRGLTFFIDSPTNQQFLVMENRTLEALSQQVAYGFWEKYDDTHTVVRFATSWATTKEDVAALLALLDQYC